MVVERRIMNFSLEDLKEALYISETIFGLFLLVLAFFVLKSALASCESLYYLIPALGIFLAGIACLVFGIGTYIVRDDPDVWR